MERVVIRLAVSVPFHNNVLAGTNLVRDAINSPDFLTGVSGWSINKDGSAEFNDIVIRGSLVVTGNAESANYVAGISGWQLRDNGTAEFNGNVDMLSAVVTGGIQSDNYVSGTSGWRLRNDGQAEFNGVFLTGTVDGKVHIGALVDTVNNVVGSEVAIGSANTQNTPQIANHAYAATVTVALTGSAVANRARFRLWDGTVGVTQLGANAPLYKVNNAATTFEAINMYFVWRAPTTQMIANINVGMEFFSGAGSITGRVENSSYNFIINDLGLASRIANL